jgi:predicted ester cyclase
MNGETLKAIVRNYDDEVWTKGNLALVDTLMAPGYVNIDPATPAPNGELHGRDGMKGLVTTLRSAIPDMVMTIDNQVTEGDVVVSQWHATGTFLGGLNGVPPTGQQGGTTGITVTTFRNGEIVSDYAIWDTLGFLMRVGALGAPAAV